MYVRIYIFLWLGFEETYIISEVFLDSKLTPYWKL